VLRESWWCVKRLLVLCKASPGVVLRQSWCCVKSIVSILTFSSYAGYCPQLKYNLGQSYGQLTAKLLTSPEVRRSARPVLHAGTNSNTDGPDRPGEEMLATSHLHREERRNVDPMIPGYTGALSWGG